MTPAQRIIGKFGSIGALARALGHANRSTVQGWWEVGTIPLKHVSVIIEASTREGLRDPVIATDFLPRQNPQQQERQSA